MAFTKGSLEKLLEQDRIAAERQRLAIKRARAQAFVTAWLWLCFAGLVWVIVVNCIAISGR